MSEKLNVVYIHSHDTGRYVQPYGHAIDTPNIQQFAEQGVLFRKAFCAAPTCSPSRAALLTGQNPHSVGMLGLAHRGHFLYDYSNHIIHTLHDHGYTSALSGVQHIAGGPDRGAEVIGYHQIIEKDTHQKAAESAADYIREEHDKPFFLSVGFTKTHRTGSKPDSEDGWHNAKDSPLGDPRYVAPPAPLPDTPQTRRDFADFKVCARRLDDQIGTVLAAIDQAGLTEKTLVIITTDHGIAFPAMKCNLTDHGMGVMLMLRGPASLGLTGGKVVDGMVSHIDLFPTICEAIGIDPPDRLEGKSAMPLVRGDTDEVTDAIFSEVTHHASYDPKRAVRTPRWKYIRRFDEAYVHPIMPNCDNSPSKRLWTDAGWVEQTLEREYLYDLLFDPNEGNNLVGSSEHADVLAEMRQRLDDWMQRTDDPLLKDSLAEMPGITYTPQDNYAPSEGTVTIPNK